MSEQKQHFYEFGPFRLDPLKRRLLRDGEPIRLTPKAFDLLLALVEESGRTIEKDELLDKVWPGTAVEENNLNQNITALRKSLGDSRQDSQYIATISGVGYRFVADVKKVDAEPVLAQRRKDAKEDAKEEVKTSVAPLRGKLFRYALPVFALLILAALVYAFYPRDKPPALGISSIMVLPLENLSGDPEQEYFADGMTDALIGDLAKIGGLHVISRTSSMHYKGTKKSMPEIARELKVDAVVEGTVQRSGERVVIRAQLIHAATDRHLWVETYQRGMRDILDLQSEIAQAVAREVQIQMTPAEQARLTSRHPVRPKAFDDYLQGRYLYWNKRTEENLRKSIGHFQSAIKEDPSYALAYAGLADCYNALGTVQVGAMPPIDARRDAEQAALKALELDSSLAEAHSTLGQVKHFNWNWTGAEQDFKRAIELNPNYANGHNFYASYLMSVGRVDESIAASNRARELDPFSLSVSAQRGFLLENARRYTEAIEQLRGVIAMDPNHYQAYWILGHTYAANQQFDEAVAAAEKAVELSERTPGALGILGLAYGLAGRKADANKVLNELLKLNESRYVTPAALVNVYIGLGDKDQAFAWLEKAYEERSNYVAYLKVFPIVDPLRSDPRFADLVRRVGLPE
ncbi:MAG TPA: winged helix-turn-helix domain-containing protein [Pyrinomonadaceae bacterium]|nr:winged helix-turn-helix domain-containing protein [Pyrinomonadaceae bacterium]